MKSKNEAVKHQLESIGESLQRIEERQARAKLLKEVCLKSKGCDCDHESLQKLQEEIQAEITRFEHCYKNCTQLIDNLVVVTKNGENRELTNSCIAILHKRYIERKDWETIAGELGYSVRQIFRLHGLGLERIEKQKDKA